MLQIGESEVLITKLAPKEDHDEDEVHYAMDCRVCVNVMTGAKDVLKELRVPTLADALWDKDGVPTMQEAQIRGFCV